MASGSTRPSRMLMTVCSAMALVGVLYLGWMVVSIDGSALARAMPYRNLVAAFVHAIETAMAELNNANSTISQPLPQYCLPSTKAGSSADVANELSRSVPQPVICPQDTTTRKKPRMRMEPRTARGMFRLGSVLSSASGAAASQPVMAKIANTTPRNSPCSCPELVAEVSQCTLIPPGPGDGQPPQAKRQDDDELDDAQHDDQLHRQFHATPRRPGHQRDEEDHEPPPLEGDPVLGLQRVLQRRAHEGPDLGDHHRVEEQVHPGHQEAGPPAEGPRDEGVIAARGGHVAAELCQHIAKEQGDDEGTEVGQGRADPGVQHDKRDREHPRDRGRDRGDALHEHAGQCDRVGLELISCRVVCQFDAARLAAW